MNSIIKREQQKLCLVYYEKMMFEQMYKRLVKPESEYLSLGLKNALLESFLLHTRNLIEFFQGTDKKPPYKKNCFDIVISDFLTTSGKKFEIVKEGEWGIAGTHKGKINKRLSHLSEERLEMDKEWAEEIKIFKEEITKKFNAFVENLSEDYFPLKCIEKFKVTKEKFLMGIDRKLGATREDLEEKKISISSTDSRVTNSS
jgi:hypothetical protein